MPGISPEFFCRARLLAGIPVNGREERKTEGVNHAGGHYPHLQQLVTQTGQGPAGLASFPGTAEGHQQPGQLLVVGPLMTCVLPHWDPPFYLYTHSHLEPLFQAPREQRFRELEPEDFIALNV